MQVHEFITEEEEEALLAWLDHDASLPWNASRFAPPHAPRLVTPTRV